MARGTLAGQLAAMGFADTARTRQLLTGDLGLDPEGADAPLVEALAAAADPDLALAALARMAPGDDLRAALRSDTGLRDRLITVLGVSVALGDHLARHPADWAVLAGPAPWPGPRPPSCVTACWPRSARSRPPPAARTAPTAPAARTAPAASPPPTRRGSAAGTRRPSCGWPTGGGCCTWPPGT